MLVANTAAWAQVNVADTNMLKIVADSTVTAKTETTAETPIVRTLEPARVIYKKEPFQPNPKKAGMYSALLPGAGQFYNKQYWKIPVIYAGLATAAYFIEFNLSKYNDYHTAYVSRISNPYYTDKYTGLYSTDNLKTLQDDYKRFLDLTVLATGVGYILQIVDAVVYSYLRNFDVSPDISLHMGPVQTPEGGAVGFVMHFK